MSASDENIRQVLYPLLKDKLLVGHRVHFAYAFIKSTFRRTNLNYQTKTLCTHKLYRLLCNDQENNTFQSFNQDATVLLNDGLASERALQTIYTFLQKIKKVHSAEKLQAALHECLRWHYLPASINSARIKEIPKSAGIYRFYNQAGVLLYIGKSVNLRARVLSHFSGSHSDAKEFKLIRHVSTLDWVETPGELSALLLEAQSIKKRKPLHNRQLRIAKNLFGFKIVGEDTSYRSVQIVALQELTSATITSIYGLFKYKQQASNVLLSLIKTQGLCAKYLGLEKKKSACFQHQLKKCRGACIGKISSTEHNTQLIQALEQYRIHAWPYSGPMIIEEDCSKKNQTIYHLIDQWCCIGSSSNKSDLQNSLPTVAYHFDLDIYRILVNHFYRKAGMAFLKEVLLLKA